MHTPGPWFIEYGMAQGGSGHVVVDDTDMAELSHIAVVKFHEDTEGETAANARLIAASPDLLSALENLVGVFLRVHPRAVNDALLRAQVLIAKVKGE